MISYSHFWISSNHYCSFRTSPTITLQTVCYSYMTLFYKRLNTDFFYIADQLGRVMDIATQNHDTLTRATWIMILRVACNLFADSTLSTTHFTSHFEGATYRSQLTQMLITSLLSDDSQIRQAAASLAYNCSNNVSIERLKKEEGVFVGIAEQEDDDWQVELLSAMVDALTKEIDEEISKLYPCLYSIPLTSFFFL